MKKTDYSKIASKYDANAERLNIPKDTLIESLLHDNAEIRILDIGCGTGNYIRAQQRYYENMPNIKWVGIDPSRDMLSIAMEKCPGTEFIQTEVESLPPFAERFHLITSHFSFHHFADKRLALEKIVESIERNGIFKYQNVIPEYMPGWWAYHYCPESVYEDRHRFWELDLLAYELEKRGFETTQIISLTKANRSTRQILDDFERRDVSQLAMMENSAYTSGLKKIQEDVSNGVENYKDEFALGILTARLRGK